MLAAYKIWPVTTQIPGTLDPYTPPTDIIWALNGTQFICFSIPAVPVVPEEKCRKDKWEIFPVDPSYSLDLSMKCKHLVAKSCQLQADFYPHPWSPNKLSSDREEAIIGNVSNSTQADFSLPDLNTFASNCRVSRSVKTCRFPGLENWFPTEQQPLAALSSDDSIKVPEFSWQHSLLFPQFAPLLPSRLSQPSA